MFSSPGRISLISCQTLQLSKSWFLSDSTKQSLAVQVGAEKQGRLPVPACAVKKLGTQGMWLMKFFREWSECSLFPCRAAGCVADSGPAAAFQNCPFHPSNGHTFLSS